MFALADCNNFFVSCERVFRPDLRDKPVLVLSGNDGCVIARSNEVKRLGIKMGVPFYQIQQQVKQYGIVHFSSNFALYGDLSSRIMHILGNYTDDLQQYSVDEAFLDLSHMAAHEEMVDMCRAIRKEILQGIGVPVSFGIAPSKTLCKIAADYAKHYAGYHGVCIIDSEDKRRKALSTVPIGDIWGIGRHTCKKLESAGVQTALDFADCSEAYARNLLHKTGWETWRELNGTACILNRDLPMKQSITYSRTFAHPVTDRSLLEHALSEFCAHAALKLRKQHSVCKYMLVFAHSSRFSNQPSPSISATLTFQPPTANTQEMLEQLIKVVRKQWCEGSQYKRGGVVMLGIESAQTLQQQLFDTRDRDRDNRLQKTIDDVNNLFGKDTLSQAVYMPTNDKLYETGQKSPGYTTNINEIITLKAD